ncbi:MAG: response regulator [Synechococcus sp.]
MAVVEDDPRLRDLLQEELQDLGVTPVLCDNGTELIALLQQQQVALILLDLTMPVMDGFTCLSVLRDQHCTIPVIVMTAHGDFSCRQRVLGAGASDFVSKPQLFEMLPRLLSRHITGLQA